MKVSDVIKSLQRLDPEDEIMIGWWERAFVSEWFYDQGELIEKDKWNDAVDLFDSWDLQDTGDEIVSLVKEVIGPKLKKLS